MADAMTPMHFLNPLETAPKDGKYFLIVGSNFDGGAAVVCWDDDFDNWTLDDGKNTEIVLRHEHKLIGWLPIPASVCAALDIAHRLVHPTTGATP